MHMLLLPLITGIVTFIISRLVIKLNEAKQPTYRIYVKHNGKWKPLDQAESECTHEFNYEGIKIVNERVSSK